MSICMDVGREYDRVVELYDCKSTCCRRMSRSTRLQNMEWKRRWRLVRFTGKRDEVDYCGEEKLTGRGSQRLSAARRNSEETRQLIMKERTTTNIVKTFTSDRA